MNRVKRRYITRKKVPFEITTILLEKSIKIKTDMTQQIFNLNDVKLMKNSFHVTKWIIKGTKIIVLIMLIQYTLHIRQKFDDVD